ncbi:hypothetical protein [Cytobacillus dafuensis]|uniref:Uncharacterized protein n=1 Tax=Cytobacillus dafuensis TaxID=1742359 RepID=A0A5B8Z703_CYTDA|nr:hypothetical protein [Cytobacillus dafuensis]QED47419.1 hypothetical protein FSZ17_09230 [Cytobacillus dafuensis]
MKYFAYLYIISSMLLTVSGCHRDKPKPETKIVAQHIHFTNLNNEIPVIGTAATIHSRFFVKHQVTGKDVLIECIVNGVSFRESNSSDKGKIILYIDGKKREEISTAAFIVKDLSSGTHRLKLEVVKGNNSSPIMNKELYVTIP